MLQKSLNITGGGGGEPTNVYLDNIKLKTIDSFNIQEKISLIKIDIEGMEPFALRGAKNLINKNRPIIYAEANTKDDFIKMDRAFAELNYIHWDAFSDYRMHLFVPLESISKDEILRNIASKIALANTPRDWARFSPQETTKRGVDRIISKIGHTRNLNSSLIIIFSVIIIALILVKF